MNKKMLKAALAGLMLSVSSIASAGLIYSSSQIGSDFRDISGSGTQFSLSDDDLTGDIAFGFNFNFYDIVHDSARISSNGFIDFGPDYDEGCCTGGTIAPAAPNGIFAGLWEDLDSNNDTTGNMFYQTIGSAGSREFIVGFYDIAHYPTGNLVNFEMIIHEGSNNLEIQYGSLANEDIHTIGIENYDGTSGEQFYRETNISQFSNTGVLFQATVPEPSTLAIFALGVMGLASRRFKKQ